MYESYWKLSSRPFEDFSTAEYYFASRSHHATLLKLRYLIEQRKGIGLIAGEHGLGKSFLTHVLEAEFQQEGNYRFHRLVFPQLSAEGTLAYLANRLGAEVSRHNSDNELLNAVETRFEQLRAEQQHTVFVIDDAHLLDTAHLQTIRLLLNLREEQRADFSLILSGRLDLLARLQRVPALDQRIVVRTALDALKPEEILPYVTQRLRVAGREAAIFTPNTAQTLFELSQGYPRRINQLCDLAMLVGFADELTQISSIEIEAAADELMSVAA